MTFLFFQSNRSECDLHKRMFKGVCRTPSASNVDPKGNGDRISMGDSIHQPILKNILCLFLQDIVNVKLAHFLIG